MPMLGRVSREKRDDYALYERNDGDIMTRRIFFREGVRCLGFENCDGTQWFRMAKKSKKVRNLMSFAGMPRKSLAVEISAQSDLLLAD